MMTGCEARVRAATIGRRDFLKFGAGAGAIMALGARQGSAQSGTSRPVSIDLHTHWAPEPYVKALAELGRPPAITPNPLNFDLDKRLGWMDAHGVQMAVLTLNGGMPWQQHMDTRSSTGTT